MRKLDTIRNILEEEFKPALLKVEDESHMHNVPDGAESHFKVLIVSEVFADKTLVARHRAINRVVKMNELGIHALALHTFSPAEHAGSTAETQSPKCLGGSGK
jgi:BolA protein